MSLEIGALAITTTATIPRMAPNVPPEKILLINKAQTKRRV